MGQFWFSKNNLTMANKIVAANKDLGNNGLNGGIFKGKRHHEGGIAVEVQGGGKVEVETDEPIIVPEAVNANKKVYFDGKKMTPKEVISKINTDFGGVPIKKKGGFVDAKAEIKRLRDIKEKKEKGGKLYDESEINDWVKKAKFKASKSNDYTYFNIDSDNQIRIEKSGFKNSPSYIVTLHPIQKDGFFSNTVWTKNVKEDKYSDAKKEAAKIYFETIRKGVTTDINIEDESIDFSNVETSELKKKLDSSSTSFSESAEIVKELKKRNVLERGGNIEQPIKVKAGSVVVTRNAALSNETHEYNGEQLTNKEILSKINHDIGGGVEFAEGGKIKSDCGCEHEKGGEISDHEETYKKWKSLVNMSKGELENFYNSEEGKEAGLSSEKANELGIHSGRESARWILKMKNTPHQEWTETMWDWANRQISFISRMSGNKGGLYDDKGNKTRKHTSLLIWGHNPEKYESGGEVEIEDTKESILKANNEDYVYLYHASPVKLDYIKTSDKSNFRFSENGFVYLATNPNNAKGYVTLSGAKPYLYRVKIKKQELLPDSGFIKINGGKNTLQDSVNLYGLARVKRPIYGNEIELIESHTFESGGNLIKRADDTYSKHGLWDSIRENEGSGRKPTKQMLEQEEKIKNNSMEQGGMIEVVLNEGNGVVINKLFNQWNIIKNEKDFDKWAENVRETKFGTYGTISLLEVLDRFNFNNSQKLNSIQKDNFIKEVKSALNNYESGGEIKKEDVMLCENCGWTWKVADSTPIDKYICYGCGHNNYKKSN